MGFPPKKEEFALLLNLILIFEANQQLMLIVMEELRIYGRWVH